MHGAIMLLLFATPLFAREPPHYVRVTPRHLIGRQINVFGLPSEWWTVSP